MDMKQKSQFTDRITRIQAGGPNTFATVYCGPQSINTPKGKAVEGVQTRSQAPMAPRITTVQKMRAGLQSGLTQVSVFTALFVAYVRYVGL
ncbi:hypothetical protein [Celeribacter sp.]|uniref:hypothetical protein n=1 Tax=Celeribacter sp. TaxID=1890673 RepID=UPI003A924B1F